jgi:assimilatory nitrate reductase catalytic subunit
MFAELGKRMGFTKNFSYPNAAAIFREHAALSGFQNPGQRIFNIAEHSTISDAAYDALTPFQWPLSQPRLFADGGFPTDDGRGRFVAVSAPDLADRDVSFPFTLNTGRLRDQWHTMTRTGFVPALMASAGEANVAISPADAARLGIAEGDLIRITTRHASTVLPATISTGQKPGEIFAAMHWTDAHSAAGSVNRLIGPERDPVSGQPGSKHEPTAIEVLPTFWHGILQCHSASVPKGQFHAAKVPLSGGMSRLTLAGWKPLRPADALSDWGARLCGADADEERVEFLDAARGSYRLGIIRAGRLHACLFIARRQDALPDKDFLASLFTAAHLPKTRTDILRGSVSSSAPLGRTICVCHNVSETTILNLVKSQNLTTVTAIGAACKAGTNCGSCKGELAQILTQTAELVS